MRLRGRTLGPIAIGLLAAGALAARATANPAARSSLAPASAPSAELVVLATAHDEDARKTEVRLVSLPEGHSRPLGAIPHPPRAVVRGDLRGASVFVVADQEGAQDRDWGSALYRVDPGGPRKLVEGVGHARRPLCSVDGSVYVERGAGGKEPSPAEIRAGRMRVDALEIVAVDPSTGATRVVYTHAGHALHLAGELGGELIVYRVSPGGADLLALERASGRSRLVASIFPSARDFTVDPGRGALLYINRDPGDPDLWAVERTDLKTGGIARLREARGDAPAPYALPGGKVAWTADGRSGLSFQSGESIAPLGRGFDAVRASTPGGEWIAMLHVPATGFDQLAAIDLSRGPRGDGLTLRLGEGERVEAVGFMGGDGGAR